MYDEHCGRIGIVESLLGARSMDIEMPQPAATSGLKTAYERMRQLIVWLGLTELAWIGYWLLANGGGASGYRVTVIAWIAWDKLGLRERASGILAPKGGRRRRRR